MRKLALLLVIAVTACQAVGGSQDIPSPYKAQIESLRDRNVELQKRCQDLQKEQAELQAEANWNAQRISTLASESLTKLGLSVNDYSVNIVKLRFEKVPK